MLEVLVDGDTICTVGPGSVLGERAVLEGGLRTATLRTLSDAKLAVATAAQLDRTALESLASQHHREDNP